MGKGPVKVLLRTRPTDRFASESLKINGDSVGFYFPKKKDAGVLNNTQEHFNFKYDEVLHNASQEDVYFSTGRPCVTSVLQGYNGTVMAYGQTGAGKTYTVTGGDDFKSRGIAPRAITDFFTEISHLPEKAFEVCVSYMEIYNERIYDLLVDDGEAAQELAVHDMPTGVHVKGLKHLSAATEAEALAHLFKGNVRRAVAEHALNVNSSRSHTIFTLHVTQRSRVESDSHALSSKFNFVDLAGSERVSKTGSEGAILREAMHINKSLSFLEQVVVALGSASRSHVPYRQCKLTNILRDSIGGNCKTIMVANIWGEANHLDETFSTLKFATRMMKVQNEYSVNVAMDPDTQIKNLQKQILELKAELQMQNQLHGKTQIKYDAFSDDDRYELEKKVQQYMAGEVDDIEIRSLRDVKEYFKIFKACVDRAGVDAEERLREKYELTEHQKQDGQGAGGGGAAANGVAGVGEVEGRGFGVGTGAAAKNIRQQAKSQSPTKSAYGGMDDVASPDAGMPMADEAEMRRVQLPDRNQAYEDFKSNEGSEQNRELRNYTAKIRELKQDGAAKAARANQLKAEIDGLKSEADKLAADETDFSDKEKFEVVDELKRKRVEFRTLKEDLSRIRLEVDANEKLVNQTRVALVQEFEMWFSKTYGPAPKAGGAAEAGDGEKLDEGECFDRMEEERLMKEDPDSLEFYRAQKMTGSHKKATKRGAGPKMHWASLLLLALCAAGAEAGSKCMEILKPEELKGVVTGVKPKTGVLVAVGHDGDEGVKSLEDTMEKVAGGLADVEKFTGTSVCVVGVLDVDGIEGVPGMSELGPALEGHDLRYKYIHAGGVEPFHEGVGDGQTENYVIVAKWVYALASKGIDLGLMETVNDGDFSSRVFLPTKVAIVIYDTDEVSDAARSLGEVSKLFREQVDANKLVFVRTSERVSGYRWKNGMRDGSGKAPSVMVYGRRKAKYTPVELPASEGYTKENLEAFVTRYAGGKLQKENDVTVLDDDLWDTAVGDSEHYFVEFYAPWCGHCKKLTPTWEKLAGAFKDDKRVRIAKIDATANPIAKSRAKVDGFPTLVWYTAHARRPEKYDGTRDYADLEQYVKETLANGGRPKPKPKAKPVEPENDGHVKVYGDSNFDTALKADASLFVEFYAPWCGHCKKLAPAWAQLAEAFKDDKRVAIGKVDATQHEALGSKYGVRGFPTLLWFGKDSKGKPEKYAENRDIGSLKAFVDKKIGGGAAGGAKADSGAAVLEITDANFAAELDGRKKDVFVKFYAPWCGHCKKLAPAWEKLGAEFKGHGKVQIAKVDLTKNNKLDAKFQGQVTGFPTLMYFGKTTEKYSKGRDLASLVSFVKAKVGDAEKKPEGKAAGPAVLELDDSNFASTISAKDKFHFVKFYAPWCGHCKRMAPTWEELGEAYKGDKQVVIANYDADKHKTAGSKYGVRGFPTLLWFGKDKENPTKYSNGRDLKSFKAFIAEQTGAGAGAAEGKADEAVMVLDDSNFESAVVKGKRHFFVKFYAPWCGHCKRMAPTWEKLGEEFKGNAKVQIAKYDADKHKAAGPKYGVRGFPTILYFGDDKTAPKKYSDARDLKALAAYVREEAGLTAAKNDGVLQLTDDNFKAEVEDAKSFTFVKFYAPWCGHCKKMAQAWEDLHKAYQGNAKIRIAELDATVHKTAATKHNVRGFPTLLLFGADKKRPIKYDKGARDLKSLKNYIDSAVFGIDVTEEAPAKEEAKDKPAPPAAEAGKMWDLTDVSFAPIPKGATGKAHLVMFHATWCGHCKRLMPDYLKLPKHFEDKFDKVTIGRYDAPAHPDLAKAAGVRSFPTIFFYSPSGKQTKFDGNRAFDDIVAFVNKQLE